MSEGLIPTLDGQRVLLASEDASGRRRYVHEDGSDVDPNRAMDIVYTSAFSSTSSDRDPAPAWWAAVDASADIGELLFHDEPADKGVDEEVASWLLQVGQSHRNQAPVKLDPGFFHTSLQAWLGDGDGPSTNATWDYSFWKAELLPIDFDDDTVPKGARVFEAKVWLGEDMPPDSIRYFISGEEEAQDETQSGWITAPPDLLRLSSSDTRESPATHALDADALFNER